MAPRLCSTLALHHCKLLQSARLRHNPRHNPVYSTQNYMKEPGVANASIIILFGIDHPSMRVPWWKIQCWSWSMWTFDSHLSPRVWSVILTDRHGVRTDCTGDGRCLASVGTQLLSGSRPDNTLTSSHHHTIPPDHRTTITPDTTKKHREVSDELWKEKDILKETELCGCWYVTIYRVIFWLQCNKSC